MQPSNFLGIYLAKDHATAAMLKIEGSTSSLEGCFSVSLEKTSAGETGGFNSLARLIAAGCAERQWKFDEAAAALDSAMFMQHAVKSEFSEAKKISQTVRFDTEEALGSDATDVAIAFKIDSTDQSGTNLSVFTTPKSSFGELVTSLQANNLDCAAIEPDISCLARFICQKLSFTADGQPLFAFLSGRNGYFVAPLVSVWQKVRPTPPAAMRTFLIHSIQNRTQLLIRQVSMTAALMRTAQPVNRLKIYDAANSVNAGEIGNAMSLQCEQIDIVKSAGFPPESLAGCADLVELSIACGAALSFYDPPASASWRSDFMPYQGRRMRLQNTLKYFSIAFTLLMMALGLYGFMQGIAYNKYRSKLRDKFTAEYSRVMFGQTIPKQSSEAVRRIRTALNRLKDAQRGAMSLTGQDAITGKLSLTLDAFNKCAAQTSLHIEQVNISDKSITITGSTSSPDNTLKVFEALRQANLDILQQRVAFESGRSTFNVTVEPKR